MQAVVVSSLAVGTTLILKELHGDSVSDQEIKDHSLSS